MTQFQDEPGVLRWRLHFRSSPAKVFDALATDGGRAGYWAESARQREARSPSISSTTPLFSGRILDCIAPRRFSVEYFRTHATFELTPDGQGGTDLLLLATQLDESIRMEMAAGWVSVPMAMKAFVDHGVDLRNHDADRAWAQGYADN